jgi:hypothetical protein
MRRPGGERHAGLAQAQRERDGAVEKIGFDGDQSAKTNSSGIDKSMSY